MKRFETIEQYYTALDRPPLAEWVREKDGNPYIPVEFVDAGLRYIYGEYNTEKITVQQIENEVIVTCEIVMIHPIYGSEIRQAGLASNQILQNAKTKVSDFKSEKKPNALEYGSPATLSSAIVNAAAKLGNFFGQNLGRKKINNPAFTIRTFAQPEQNKEVKNDK